MTIAEQVTRLKQDFDEVYEAGKAAGGGGDTEEAYQQGVTDGKQAEYDAFWDAYQDYGNRTDCKYMFAGWAIDIFNPKYMVKPTNCTMMFAYSKIDVDVFSHPMFDFSNLTIPTQMFSGSVVTRLGTYTATEYNGLRYMFHDAKQLISIEKLIVGESSYANYYQNAFMNCSALEEVRFEGTIVHNQLSLQQSTKLSKASIESIINALSATKSGLSVTLSKTAVISAFGDTTAGEWTALIATKPNWTITLA